MPYDKWRFRALRELPRLSALAEPLEHLISSGNGAAEVKEKAATVEAVCTAVADALRDDGLIIAAGNDMERHAYAVNDRIADGEIRNLHLLYGV
jgi:hypothetical protein